MQELQRLQEEQTGKKRQEKLEWMYSTPATGSSQNQNELEDYLLGKRRVDKLLTGTDNEKVRHPFYVMFGQILKQRVPQLGAAHKSFIATQYANTARDTASKIREDPLLAIKQQEQAAYQALLSNPLRLKELQERNGVKPKKEKKDKKEKKKHRKDKHRERSLSPRADRYRSPTPDRYSRPKRSPSPLRRDSRSRSPRRYDSDRYGRDRDHYSSRRDRSYSRSPGPSRHRERSRSRGRDIKQEVDRVRTWPRSDDSDDNGPRRDQERDRRDYASEDKKRRFSRSPVRRDDVPPKRPRISPSPPPRRNFNDHSSKPQTNAADDRAARLAAMSSDASTMSVERRERLTQLLAQEKAELEVEERLRTKSKGMGSFLSHESKKVFSAEGGLEARIKRGRGQMYVGAD